MGYRLGVDLGTTYTAAAVLRAGAAPEVVPLGTRSAAVPSVLFLSPDLGDLLVGEAAERRAVTDPDRVVRHFKRRIGDETPLLIDRPAGRGPGTAAASYAAHDLAAVVIAWVVARVAEREGAKPEAIAVTHPATWGPHKKELLRGALAVRGLDVTFVTEPEAAARTYAATRRLDRDATLAVYDLGGGTFDAALLRPCLDGGFVPVGHPRGLADLGGIDFDDAILSHVLTAVGPAAAELDGEDPVVATALARLRRECVDAKEALSSDTTTEIPVLLPDARTNVRLTRAELEAMIAPRVRATIDALDGALASAGLSPADLTNVVLTGGSSRIPVVAQMLSAHLGAPVSLERDVDPKMAVAVGAVLALAPVGADAVSAAVAAISLSKPADAADLPSAAPAGFPGFVPDPAEPGVLVPAARSAAASLELAPPPARPARPTPESAGLAQVDRPAVPSGRSRLRPKRALVLVGLATALILGAGAGIAGIRGLNGDQGGSATEVSSGDLEMAKPAKKKHGKDKDKDSDGASDSSGGAGPAAASTGGAAQVAYRPAGAAAPGAASTAGAQDSRPSEAASSSRLPTAEQASATRRAATEFAAPARDRRPAVTQPMTAAEFEAPAIAAEEGETEAVSSAAGPAEQSAPEAPASSDVSSGDSGGAPSGGWSEPAKSAPAAEPAAVPAEAAPSGFAETAPPEAP